MSDQTAPDWPEARAPSLSRRLAALRSIGALMLREMSSRFGKTPGGYIWVVLQPLGIIIILGLAFSLLQRRPQLGTSFFLFMASGFTILNMFKTISQLVGQSLSFSKPLLEYPGVVWIDTILARFLLNTLIMVLVTALLLGGIILYEGLNLVIDWPRIVQAVMLNLMVALGVGCLNCVLFLRFDAWSTIYGLMTAPLMLLSGVIFLYEDLPRNAQDILWYNPILHTVGMMRDGIYAGYNPAYVSVAYVSAFALIPMLLGLLILRRYHRELLER